MRIPLHRPVLGDEEARAVAEVLRSGFLVQGPRVLAFEEAIGRLLGVPHAVAVSSGTAALHLALLALDVGPGDDVVVPAFGFPATANVVELTGARAVPADVDPETFSVTRATVEEALTPRTAAVMPVHPYGIPAPMSDLESLASERGFRLVEDAACALGTAPRGRWGSGRHPVCLSFHPRKTITTGEGGMVLTGDPELAARIRRLRNHGMDPEPSRGWRRFVEVGFNYRMTDLQGAVGVVQAGRLESLVEERRRVAGLYREALAGVTGIRWPRGYDLPELGFQSLVVLLAPGLDRDAVLRGLHARDIEATVAGYALAEQPAYAARYDRGPASFPGALDVDRHGLTLPLSAAMTERDVADVAGTLASLVLAPGGDPAP